MALDPSPLENQAAWGAINLLRAARAIEWVLTMWKFLLLSICTLSALAQDRPVPPPGIAVSAEDRAVLEKGLAELTSMVSATAQHPLSPDVKVISEAVRFALTYNEFFNAADIQKAKDLLKTGMARAKSLEKGAAPWAAQNGLIMRGYVSKIDGSVQPYVLLVPPEWSPNSGKKWRLDTWFHGRGETLSEVNFLTSKAGEFTPPETFVLYLYGRYCNANKFAGEVDLFEALADVKKHYRIDDNRIVIRGFSMGGASVWHFAAHYPGHWAAAAPGAGFSESAEFLKIPAAERALMPDWEKKLWRMYDATEYAANFYNVPLVAYSGEIDGQKQAADLMAKYLAQEGMSMTHVIGPKTPHRYHPDSKIEINRRLDAIAEKGRDPYPRRLRFTTFTLAYNRNRWLIVDGMGQHWERAQLDAEINGEKGVNVKTSNVTAFTLNFGPGGAPLDPTVQPEVKIDGQTVRAKGIETDRSWIAHFRNDGGRWLVSETAGMEGVAKRHGLQGPIDDAFRNSFIMVTPTGSPMASAAVTERIAAEQTRAIKEWRKQFRGDARVKTDAEITDAEIASSNLVLWGDPQSNKILARIADKLPLKWGVDGVLAAGKKFDAATNMPIFTYPNPLNPKKYVVINSGFTFREFDYLNNARQISKLPDWAVIDVTTAADGRHPGKIAAGGFFNESWKW